MAKQTNTPSARFSPSLFNFPWGTANLRSDKEMFLRWNPRKSTYKDRRDETQPQYFVAAWEENRKAS